MILLLVCILWLLVLGFFLITLIKALLYRKILDPQKNPVKADLPFVTIVVPARNEEENIFRCIDSILGQNYAREKFKLIVVNDNSEDRTESIVKAAMAGTENIELINADPLPDGWTGKNHACWQAAEHLAGEYYCFLDADTKADPRLLEMAVSYAEKNGIDLLSVNPFQELGSITERIFLPGVFLAIAASMDFKKINEPGSRDAVANGQFLLFKADTYRAINGHEAVRDTIMEDIAFARMVKAAGYKLVFIFGDDLILTRMYSGLKGIWEGFSKNISHIMDNHGLFSCFWSAAKSIIIGVLPFVLLLMNFLANSGDDGYFLTRTILLAAGFTGMIATGVSALWAMKIPLWYLFTLPAGFMLHTAITVGNIVKQKTGGKRWKGRIYK
jgi:chlorobactene glucosyltransferase